MKKVKYLSVIFTISAIFASFMLMSACAEGEPGLIMEFNDTVDLNADSASDCELNYDQTSMLVTSLNGPGSSEKSKGDVHVIYPVKTFEADKYQWIKIKIKNLSDAKVFEMHFATTATENAITAETCTHFPITSKDGDYKEYIFNLKDYNIKSKDVNAATITDSVWKGKVSQIRFDFMWIAEPSGQVPTGSKMYIDYAAFFESESAAKAYVHTESKENVPPTTESTPTDEIVDKKDYSNVDYSNCITFVFNNIETIEKWSPGGSTACYEFGFCRIIPTSGDPTLTYVFKDNEKIDTAKVKYLGLQYKINSAAGAGVYFVATDKHEKFSDEGHKSFNITKKKWTSEVIDLSLNAFWEGTLEKFRLDIINGLDLNADILIERIGFFETAEQANAFLSKANTVPDYSKTTAIRASMQKVIIPGGVLSEGFNKGDYLLKSTKPDGSSASSPVVKRVDKNGKEEIVALGYTNGANFTTYVANKPGTYTLGYNHKDYSDIVSHWGEEYINFVSDRGLFGGTAPTEFSPDMTMTRGMFITVLGRMHGLDTSPYNGESGYADVNSSEYYAPYIQWSKAFSIMDSTSATTFSPEEAVSREVMAKVINNYVKVYNYVIPTTKVPDFEDLNQSDANAADAIRFVQSLGIINGNTPTTFNPKGISTRAEVATVMKRVVNSILGIPTYAKQQNFDRIMLGGWSNFRTEVTDEVIKQFADAGLNFIVGTGEFDSADTQLDILKYANKYGVQVLFHNYPAKYFENEADVPMVGAELFDYPSYMGHHIIDEPGSDQFEELGKVAEQYKKAYPGKIPYYNLLPMYANAAQLKYGAGAAAIEYYDPDPALYRKHVEEYAQKIDTHYICVDVYPFSSQNATYVDYCKNLDIFASVCREYNRDFWLYVQTVGLNPARIPNEQELRWQFYTGLSFGVKGFIHFTYGSYNQSQNFAWSYSMINDDGTPTPTYFNAQTVNLEMNAISDVYVQYKNLGAFNVNCAKTTPYLQFDNQYKGFKDLKSIDSESPLLVGCFEKKDGNGSAFTIVNMIDVSKGKQATATFSVEGNKTVTAYLLGKKTTLTPKDGIYTLSLDCGQGVFITVE